MQVKSSIVVALWIYTFG